MADGYSVIALSPIRKVIAARMTEASAIPHFRLAIDVEVDALIALRQSLQQQHSGNMVSLNDLLIKACAAALMDAPAVNVQWVEADIHRYHSAEISVVMSIEGGALSTPIVRRAESKSVWEIAREVREFRDRAAKNLLKMHEIVGGSFSISNLGMYAVDQFDAIINPPQCAILAIGAAKLRAVAASERETRIATLMRVTLSCDHRAIDGATGAAFLSALRLRIERPEHMAH